MLPFNYLNFFSLNDDDDSFSFLSHRFKLSQMLTKRQRINNETVHLLTAGAASEVEIGNCTALDEEDLGCALSKCDLGRMVALRLNFCGRYECNSPSPFLCGMLYVWRCFTQL